MSFFSIQTALKSQGFDPGPLDGIWGRRTEQAVKALQKARGLTVDGVVGEHTARALFVNTPFPPPIGPVLPWMEEARRLSGVREVVGSESNSVILQWADDLDLHYKDDDIPWCGLFVAHCIGATLSSEPLPANPLGARNWLKFGAPCQPVWGAVLVFWRGSPAGWQGHVGFYEGEDGSAYHVLGGNQSNRVSVARVAKNRLLGARQPMSIPPLQVGSIDRAETGPLSTLEG
ncbi:NlpC/P60 family protein [Azospirillum doebereinerae]